MRFEYVVICSFKILSVFGFPSQTVFDPYKYGDKECMFCSTSMPLKVQSNGYSMKVEYVKAKR
jgi:hypothetical protein